MKPPRGVLKNTKIPVLLSALAVLLIFGNAGDLKALFQPVQQLVMPDLGGEAAPASPRLVMPLPDGARGRRIFVAKGCVLCHSVAGVGGKAAPALDASGPATEVDPLAFAARMWRGAPAMLELQAVELGYRIELEGRDIADLAAFVDDASQQAGFAVEEIPEMMRDWILDQPYWEEETWPDDWLKPDPE